MNIIVSMGDCNGIGLEVFAKALAELPESYKDEVTLTLAGNPQTAADYFRKMNLGVALSDNELTIKDIKVKIDTAGEAAEQQFGRETSSAGLLAAKSIEYALAMTLDGTYDALLTLPVSKAALYKAGWKFPGHTEMLANYCKTDNQQMILCTEKVRVALATVHEALLDVPELLNESMLQKHFNNFIYSLKRDYGIKHPRLAVLGLNPHAGEDGAMGKEELEIIIPAINKYTAAAATIEGPFPADGFFAHGAYKEYDGILAMYHDQGLIPLKLLAEGAGVNFTAGLPIVRTSPDHGTAFAVAGKNIASGRSTLQALMMACDVVHNRKNFDEGT